MKTKKEKSCALKKKKFAPSGVGVDSQKAPLGDGVKAPSGVGVIPSLNAILEFFVLMGYPPIEAEKFFNYFQSNGWLVGGKTKMKDWNAAARNWILNAKSFKQPKAPIPITNNLQITQNKNYNEPL